LNGQHGAKTVIQKVDRTDRFTCFMKHLTKAENSGSHS
jgi:hypothetical protein